MVMMMMILVMMMVMLMVMVMVMMMMIMMMMMMMMDDDDDDDDGGGDYDDDDGGGGGSGDDVFLSCGAKHPRPSWRASPTLQSHDATWGHHKVRCKLINNGRTWKMVTTYFATLVLDSFEHPVIGRNEGII